MDKLGELGLQIISGIAVGVFTAFIGFLTYLSRKLSCVSKDVAVIKVYVSEALAIKERVNEDHDNLVRIDERVKNQKKDLDVLHQKTRDITQAISKY